MQDKYKDKGVVLVALTDEPLQLVSRLAANLKINYLVGMESSRTRSAYGARSFPTVYVIDRDGKIAYWSNSAKAAEAVVDRLLKDQPPRVAQSVATRYAEERLARADGLMKDKNHIEALREYQQIVDDFGQGPIADRAAKELKALKADPQLAAIIENAEAKARQDTRCNKLLHLARALANAGHGRQARQYYDQVTKDCTDTEYADLAVNERASLDTAGK